MIRKTAIGPCRSRAALQRKRASPSISYAQSVSPSLYSATSLGVMMASSIVSRRSAGIAACSSRTSSPCRRRSGRLARAQVEVGRAGVHQDAEQPLHDGAGLGQIRPARGGRRRAIRPRSGAGRGRADHGAGPSGSGRELDPDLAGRCPVGKRHRRWAAHGGLPGDLAQEPEDLGVGQRVLGDRTDAAIGHQRGRLARRPAGAPRRAARAMTWMRRSSRATEISVVGPDAADVSLVEVAGDPVIPQAEEEARGVYVVERPGARRVQLGHRVAPVLLRRWAAPPPARAAWPR